MTPYAAVWQDDRYYMIGFSESHGKVAKFRLDRMEKPRILQKEGVPVPEGFDLTDYVSRVFRMYDEGETAEVTLRCREGMEDHLIDHFGPGLTFRPVNDKYFDVTVTVNTSRTFFGWLFQYVGEMNLIGPEAVCSQYARILREGLEIVQAGE